MLRKGVFAVATVLVAACVGASASLAGGPPVTCIGTFTGVAPGNLIVPSGQFCIIIGATVGNNVLVEPGAIGFAAHQSNIGGSVLSPGPIVFDIRVLNSTVGHNVEVSNTRAGTVGLVCRSTIGGNVTLSNNAGSMLVGRDDGIDVCVGIGNTIGGNVDLSNNSGEFDLFANQVEQSVHVDDNTGIELIQNNTIDRTLECSSNVPPPVSAGNTADNYAGQCTS